MGQQMTPDTAKIKCKNFLATLLRLASEQPESVARNVRTLIQVRRVTLVGLEINEPSRSLHNHGVVKSALWDILLRIIQGIFEGLKWKYWLIRAQNQFHVI